MSKTQCDIPKGVNLWMRVDSKTIEPSGRGTSQARKETHLFWREASFDGIALLRQSNRSASRLPDDLRRARMH